jgi:hypothetical protein
MRISTNIDGEEMWIAQESHMEGSYTEGHSPERNLYASVMGTAIHDLERYLSECVAAGKPSKVLKNHYRVALEWFSATMESPVPFDMCCEALGLNKQAILDALILRGVLPSGGALVALEVLEECEDIPSSYQYGIFEQ